jgi:hypothetical protein
MSLCSQLGLLTPSRLTLVSPSGQRAAVCLGSRHSPRLSIIRKDEDAYHDIHHRMVQWQQEDTQELKDDMQ